MYSSSLENVYSIASYIEYKCGRIIRCSKDKESAEFFTIVINNTVETKWMQNAKENSDIILLDEEGLMHVLNGEPYQPYQRSIQSFLYRF